MQDVWAPARASIPRVRTTLKNAVGRVLCWQVRTGAFEQLNSVSHIGLWYRACSSVTYWIVSVALQPYLCVAMKSTVSSPQPG